MSYEDLHEQSQIDLLRIWASTKKRPTFPVRPPLWKPIGCETISGKTAFEYILAVKDAWAAEGFQGPYVIELTLNEIDAICAHLGINWTHFVVRPEDTIRFLGCEIRVEKSPD